MTGWSWRWSFSRASRSTHSMHCTREAPKTEEVAKDAATSRTHRLAAKHYCFM